MANIKSLYNDEQNKLNTSGASTVINNDSAGAVDPTVSQAQTTGNWTNLSKYLDANHDLGGNVGNAVTADSQSKIDSAAGKINDYQAKASQVDKSQGDRLAGYQNQIANDPTKIDAAAYKKDTSAAYGNITDATKGEGYGDTSKAFGNAAESYGNLKSNDWNQRATAVQDTFGKNNAQYSKGMGALDTFVLQGDDSGKEALNKYVTGKNAAFAGDTGTRDEKGNFTPGANGALSKATAGVQGSLDAEKNRWNGLLDSNKTAITDKRNGILAGDTLKNTRLDRADTQRAGAETAIANKFTDAGLQAPESVLNYYTPGDQSGYIDPNELAALDSLSGLDGSPKSFSSSKDLNVDWNSIGKNIDGQLAKKAEIARAEREAAIRENELIKKEGGR